MPCAESAASKISRLQIKDAQGTPEKTGINIACLLGQQWPGTNRVPITDGHSSYLACIPPILHLSILHSCFAAAQVGGALPPPFEARSLSPLGYVSKGRGGDRTSHSLFTHMRASSLRKNVPNLMNKAQLTAILSLRNMGSSEQRKAGLGKRVQLLFG